MTKCGGINICHANRALYILIPGNSSKTTQEVKSTCLILKQKLHSGTFTIFCLDNYPKNYIFGLDHGWRAGYIVYLH